VVLGAAALAVRVGLREQLEPRQAARLLQQAASHAWAVPAFAALYVVLTSALAPAVVFHMVAGATWGFPLGLALNLLLFNATATVHFWAARRLGRERVVSLLSLFGLGGWVARLDQAGLASAIAVRVLPFPTLVASGSAGISGMSWRVFALGTLLGAIPWVGIYTYFSAALVAGAEGAQRRSFVQALIAAVVILAGTAAARLVARRRSRGA
jgi:uncharacterized membrane protein YdjX (TVP38/TMEM64 family)